LLHASLATTTAFLSFKSLPTFKKLCFVLNMFVLETNLFVVNTVKIQNAKQVEQQESTTYNFYKNSKLQILGKWV